MEVNLQMKKINIPSVSHKPHTHLLLRYIEILAKTHIILGCTEFIVSSFRDTAILFDPDFFSYTSLCLGSLLFTANF